MPETADPCQHVRPFVYETLSHKALHFSICEIQSRMEIADPFALDLEYTRTMMGFLLLQPDPEQIVMIGLGGGSLAKFCHRNLRGARIEVAEVNPHVIALRGQFHVPPDDERLRVVRDDGARYVRRRASPCDVLLVDGFDSDGQPAALCSQRFYDDARSLLAPDGLMVVNLHFGHAQYMRHLRRIRRSFDDQVLVVDDDEGCNSIVFACNGSALDRPPPGVIRPPRGLRRDALRPLLGAFARVAAAWRDERA